MKTLNVLLIESDPKARLSMLAMLNAADDIGTVSIASNAMQARMQVKMRQPDVLVLATAEASEALEAFLVHTLEAAPMPVVLLAAHVLPNSDAERKLMRAGMAVLLRRPATGITRNDQGFATKLLAQVRQVSRQFASRYGRPPAAAVSGKPAARIVPQSSTAAADAAAIRHRPLMDQLIAIGASTGGTEALRHVIKHFPSSTAAVVIVQHLPKAFAATFIKKLDEASPMRVVAAEDGMAICKGYIYVGAGDEQFTIERNAQGFICRVGGRERVSGHCPSVNVLFDSVAEHAGSKAVGALMTGMGDDGASGLKKMREARARTLAQDKDSSVVWGMPGSAVKIGAAEEQVALHALGERLIHLSR